MNRRKLRIGIRIVIRGEFFGVRFFGRLWCLRLGIYWGLQRQWLFRILLLWGFRIIVRQWIGWWGKCIWGCVLLRGQWLG
jgi:hypothetical protein